MNWNGRLRMMCTPAVGAAIVSGAVGAALLAGPLIGAQAEEAPLSYYNGGFCYRHPNGQENTSRLQFTEVDSSPVDYAAHFSWQLQKWDAESNQYHNDGDTMETSGAHKRDIAPNGGFSNPNEFCRWITPRLPLKVGDSPYSYGEWTSRREPPSSPASSPVPSQP